MTLKVGSLVRHKVIRRDDDVNVYRYGIAIKKVEDNPFLVDCERTMLVFDELMRDVNEDYEVFTFDNPYNRRRR